MSIPRSLSAALGAWEGNYRLWFGPGDPAAESHTSAEIGTVGGGRFLTMSYTWMFEGKPHEGFILLGVNPMASELRAEWVDSFHNSDRIMECTGPVPAGDGTSGAGMSTDEDVEVIVDDIDAPTTPGVADVVIPGEVSVLGSYPAPPGPDWGWRTVLEQPTTDEFRMVMYNIAPGQPEVLAVEAVYKRPA